MCDHSLFLESTSGTSPPRGPPLWKIYVIMSLEPENADESAEIPVDDGVQKTDPKDSDSEIMEALVSKDSETYLLQLSGDSDHIKEPPCKAVGKDDH